MYGRAKGLSARRGFSGFSGTGYETPNNHGGRREQAVVALKKL